MVTSRQNCLGASSGLASVTLNRAMRSWRPAARTAFAGRFRTAMGRPQMMTLSTEQQAMVALFQRHVDAELAGDLETTMATMTDDPHLNHVASMAGGVGRGGVR